MRLILVVEGVSYVTPEVGLEQHKEGSCLDTNFVSYCQSMAIDDLDHLFTIFSELVLYFAFITFEKFLIIHILRSLPDYPDALEGFLAVCDVGLEA